MFRKRTASLKWNTRVPGGRHGRHHTRRAGANLVEHARGPARQGPHPGSVLSSGIIVTPGHHKARAKHMRGVHKFREIYFKVCENVGLIKRGGRGLECRKGAGSRGPGRKGAGSGKQGPGARRKRAEIIGGQNGLGIYRADKRGNQD